MSALTAPAAAAAGGPDGLRALLLSFDDGTPAAPPLGGQGVAVAGLAGHLPAAGAAVTVCSSRRGPAGFVWPGGGPTGRPALDFSWWLARRLPRLGRLVRPQVWHAQSGPGGVLLLRLPAGAPLVVTANHTYRQAHGGWWATRPLAAVEGRGYRAAAHVLAISPSTAVRVVADHGVQPGRVSVVAPGIDTDRFRPPRDDEPDRDRATLLFCGRLDPVKGLRTFAALVDELALERPELRAVVCGEGPERGAAADLGRRWPGRVTVTGRLDDDALARCQRRATVCVMPSAYEGLGLVALEALSSETPVVAHDVSGLHDLGPAGVVLVPAGAPLALAAAVRTLLDDPGRRTALGARGRAHVLERHRWTEVAAATAAVYRRVAQAG